MKKIPNSKSDNSRYKDKERKEIEKSASGCMCSSPQLCSWRVEEIPLFTSHGKHVEGNS